MHLSTDADSSTDTKKILLARQNSPKTIFFLRSNFTPFMSKSLTIWDHFFPFTFPQGFLISKKFRNWISGSGGKKMFKRSEYMRKKSVANVFGCIDFWPMRLVALITKIYIFFCKHYKYCLTVPSNKFDSSFQSNILRISHPTSYFNHCAL